MGLAMKEGLEAVSMRKVAALLDVEAMSLYKYVESKDDLFDGLIEKIIEKITLPAEEADWRQALRARALSEYKVLSEHSWIVHLLEARSGTGHVRLSHQNHMIGILRRSGFPIELAFQTMVIVAGYVYGFVVFATAWSPKSKERAKTTKKAAQEIKVETYPYVLEAISFAQSRPQTTEHRSEFEFGLDLIIDGIERSLNRSQVAK